MLIKSSDILDLLDSVYFDGCPPDSSFLSGYAKELSEWNLSKTDIYI